MGRKKKLSELEKHYQKITKKGGKARAEKLTPERRKEIASEAAKKRWKKDDA